MKPDLSSTNAAGLYDFAGLHIGTYQMKVVASGFKAYETTGIVMNVAATVREDVDLTLGSSSTTVTVQANALHLQTETNEVSNLITGSQLTQLATNGRNMVSLTTLGTGVSNNLVVQWRHSAGQRFRTELQRHAPRSQQLAD